MAGKPGADANEVMERVNKVYSLMLIGKRNRDIIKLVTEHYKVCEKTAYNYINKANEIREEEHKEYREIVLTDQVSHLRNLYEKNYKVQDFKECRNILNQIADLFGIKAPVKSEVAIKEQPLFGNE